MLIVEFVRQPRDEGQVRPGEEPSGGKLQDATRKRGLIVRCSNDGIAIAPPLIISKSQCDEVAGTIAESIKEVLG